MVAVNQRFVQQCQTLATGADVHMMNGILQRYMNAAYLANRGDSHQLQVFRERETEIKKYIQAKLLEKICHKAWRQE